ncbi:MAG: PD-(D/E)XK nuclease family protein, partial [Puniceicoccales bacterium]|nr:PD-(D/E)XK nuclease family protein [Puniceicoccales bacterium]
FVKKTTPILPEIREKTSHFPPDLNVKKSAFLAYALAVHRAAKPLAKEPFFCPIFIVDMATATRLHFEHVVAFCDKTAPNDAAAPDNFENLFPLLSAKFLHLIAEKNNIPTYFAQQYQTTRRQTLDASAIQMLSRSFAAPAADYDPAPYEILSKINAQRNNELENFGPFEYTAGGPDMENLSIPVTAIERAFADPEAIWYRYVAQNDRPPLRFEKQKFDGIFTHSLLQWPSEIRPTPEAFRAHIAQKQKHRQHILEQFSPGLLLRDALNSENPYILAEKIAQWDDFPFMASECDLRSTFSLEDGTTVPLHGRADCILSQFPLRRQFHKGNADNRLLVIDFKTGSATQSDLQKLAKPFTALPPSLSGLQLVLYGLILENFGYKNIELSILNGDPYEQPEPIALRSITQSENFSFIKNFLKNLIVKGIFGYGENNLFLGRHFPSPIAAIPPNNAAIREKRKKLFWTF